MIRGMHYMCWFSEDWNYHPSMMMKRIQQVQDVADFHGDVLLWSCMGSAAIGLQYLDREANETIPPRLRFYGHLNDREFSEECTKRGITAYAVVWKAQLWEFPAEFNEDESELLSLNKLRGVGKQGWLGMRELSTDRYPKLFNPISDYFPDGIRNSDGELVTDFLDEFKIVSLEGNDVESRWLLVPGHDHHCYTPCGSNPAFMQYMKKEVEMMIDANAGGVMIDEFDMHLHGLHNAGCFCKDCMKQFRAYLSANPDEDVARFNLDLDTFHYGQFLQARGYSDSDLLAAQGAHRYQIPLFRQFVEFNLQRMDETLEEILSYAKAYSLKTRGSEIPVAVNLFNCLPHCGAARRFCDIIIGEKSNIQLRQDGFYRYAYAFFGGKQGSFIEDPGDHILRIVDDLKEGHTDSYVLLMLEPLAQGFNIAIPYGAWLINLVKDSFWPPMETERQMGAWLKAHERLFEPDPVADIAIVYDMRSALEVEMFEGGHLDKRANAGFNTFHDLTQTLCNNHILFNVLYVNDEEPLTPERLASYGTVIFPDAFSLKETELQNIEDWVDAGGKAITLGRSDPCLAQYRYSIIKQAAFLKLLTQEEQQLVLEPGDFNRYVGLGLHRVEGGYALHIVNYWLNDVTRKVETIPELEITLAWEPDAVCVHAFPPSQASATIEGKKLHLKDVGLYTVIELQGM